MQIRQLALDDAPAYRALRLRGLREHPEAFTSSWEEDQAKPLLSSQARLQDPRTTFLGAFDGELLAGVVGLERLPRAKERHKGWVVGMYVAPEQGGRGFGRALLRAVCERAQTEGLRDLLLSVTDGNATALRLYQAAGFVVVGREPRAVLVDGRFLDKLHMHRALA
jgi:ribosomal protein S18 acetylase RimI-like enzyme